jgi:tetratricopeptide (TPR) repeat protein
MTSELERLVVASTKLARAEDWGPEALRVNRRLAAAAPGSAPVLLRLARCLVEAGELEAARDAYSRLFELEPDEQTRRIAQHKLAEIRARLGARRVVDPLEALRLGEEAVAKGKLDEGAAWFERALALVERDGGDEGAVLRSWAGALRYAGKAREALRPLRRAAALDPSRRGNTATFVALVATLAEAGEPEEARLEADRLLQAVPTDTAVLAAAAKAYAALAARRKDPATTARAEALRRAAAGGRRA